MFFLEAKDKRKEELPSPAPTPTRPEKKTDDIMLFPRHSK